MRTATWTIGCFLLMVLLAACVAPGASNAPSAPPAFSATSIPLPNGFAPEGIAIGPDGSYYTGSLSGQGIYKGTVATGEGSTLVAGSASQPYTGMKVNADGSRLFAAGAATGSAFVYDAKTGEPLAQYVFADPGASFINDVTLAGDAAFFTDSNAARLFVLPLAEDGALPPASGWKTLLLTGEWSQVDGLNANGIAATPDGKLIVVNSTTGGLYLVDPGTGEAKQIDVGGESFPAGDGILLDGTTLYVVRNRANEIVVVDLAKDFTSGKVTGRLTDPLLRVPTTLASDGTSLYTVNARFGTQAGPDVDYDIVKLTPASPQP